MGEVYDLLVRCGLGEYAVILTENGFEDVKDLQQLTDEDLVRLGVDKMGHRIKLLRILKEGANGELKGTPKDEALKPNQQPTTRKRSHTYTPISPTAIRSQPRYSYTGDKIRVEVIAAKLEVDHREKVAPQVKMSICKTVDNRGVPVDSTIRRTSVGEGTQPVWHETFEFPATLSKDQFLVFTVNNKVGLLSKRLGLLAIPMKFFIQFTSSSVIDNWFPLKTGSGEAVGEIHLSLRVPGGMPSEIGKAFKVTGVKMDARKLIVEVMEGQVPANSKGQPRSTYVKLTLPKRPDVVRETSVVKDSLSPQWNEAFEFFTEVKNAQYLIVKLKRNKLMSHKTIGVAKVPLMFFLSLKERTTIDDWFAVKDEAGKETGRVRVRLLVKNRTRREKYLLEGDNSAYEVTASPEDGKAAMRREREYAELKRRKDDGEDEVDPGAEEDAAFEEDGGDLEEAMQNEEVECERGGGEEEEEEEFDPSDGCGSEEVEELDEGGDDDDDDDTFDVDAHEEDFTPYSPLNNPPAQSGGVFWPPPPGTRIDASLVYPSSPAS